MWSLTSLLSLGVVDDGACVPFHVCHFITFLSLLSHLQLTNVDTNVRKIDKCYNGHRCLKDDKTSQWKGGNSQGCPQDVKSQDRDNTETVNFHDRDET